MKKTLLLAAFLSLPLAAIAADYDDPGLYSDDPPLAADPLDFATRASRAATPKTTEFPGHLDTYGNRWFGYVGSAFSYDNPSSYYWWGYPSYYWDYEAWDLRWDAPYASTGIYYSTYRGASPYMGSQTPRYAKGSTPGTWYVYGGELAAGAIGSPVLQQAVNAASAGDVIYVTPGIYSPIRTNNKDLTIIATKGRLHTIIRAFRDEDSKTSRKVCVDAGGSGARKTKIKGFSILYGCGANGGGVIGGTLSDCCISGCYANGNGGGAYGAALTDCILVRNGAERGGAAFNSTLNRCLVYYNGAASGGGIQGGSAHNCLFYCNDADTNGGAAVSATLVNCTVVDNEAPYAGGVDKCTVKNSIVSGNHAGRANPNHRSSSFQYTCTFPVPKGTGNFNASPGFVTGDFRLANTSKCRDKGSSALTSSPYDLAGLPRKLGKSVDLGCYEYPTTLTPLDPIDFDGDHLPDLGFFQSSTGLWFIRQTLHDSVLRVKLGASGVKPVPMDHDGDGVADLAFYNPSNGVWQIRHSYSGKTVSVTHGWKGINLVQAADWDGDGKSDLIFCNPANGVWQVKKSSTGQTQVVRWRGWAGIQPVCGDYDGDGRADLAFYAPSSSRFYILPANGTEIVVPFNQTAAKPCPGDYDHDGALEPAVFLPSTGTWTFRPIGGTASTLKFGDKTVSPHCIDWNNDGVPDTPAFFSPFRAGWMQRCTTQTYDSLSHHVYSTPF